MKKYIILFILIFTMTISACNENSEEACASYDYSDCNTAEPDSAFVEIEVTCNSTFPSVPVTLYKGLIDDNILILRDTLNNSGSTYKLPINQYYSATAEYHTGDKIIFTLDGGKIKKKSEKNCDSTCWKIVNENFDLRLKYN